MFFSSSFFFFTSRYMCQLLICACQSTCIIFLCGFCVSKVKYLQKNILSNIHTECHHCDDLVEVKREFVSKNTLSTWQVFWGTFFLAGLWNHLVYKLMDHCHTIQAMGQKSSISCAPCLHEWVCNIRMLKKWNFLFCDFSSPHINNNSFVPKWIKPSSNLSQSNW